MRSDPIRPTSGGPQAREKVGDLEHCRSCYNREEATANHSSVGGRVGSWRYSRALEAHHGDKRNGCRGASTSPPRAHAAVPSLRGQSAEPSPPPSALQHPLTDCSGILPPDTAFKVAAPPPGNPLQPVPCNWRRASAILSPFLLPPQRHLHSENGPGRPAAFTFLAGLAPTRRPGAPRPPPRPLNESSTTQAVYGARLRSRLGQPGSSRGLTAASSRSAQRHAPRRPA